MKKKMSDRLPKEIVIENEKYYLGIEHINDGSALDGIVLMYYTDENQTTYPEILIEGFYEYLCSFGFTEDEAYEDMERKLKFVNKHTKNYSTINRK